MAASNSNTKTNDPPKGQASIPAIEKYLNSKYLFRYNPILERTEFSSINEGAFKLLTDRDVNSLFRELNNNELKCTLATLRSLLNSNFVEEDDPFVNYFSSLPKWKRGDHDYIDDLANTIDAENKDFWKAIFKKWLVNVVACAVNREAINHQILVFAGKQGIGKSSWLNKLVPPSLAGYLYCGIVNPANKDTLVNLSENLIINLDELEHLNKTELGNLKTLVTLSAIRLRKAYGYFNENFVRRASFVGSVNEVEFLTDGTGNRRYLVIKANDIDYRHTVDMDKVYSQAYSLYRGGFKYYFEKDDIEAIDENNYMFLQIGLEEELLLKYYRVPKAGDKVIIEMTTTDILGALQKKTKLKIDDYSARRKLGVALQKHGFPRASKGNSKPYKMVARNGKSEETEQVVETRKPNSIRDKYKFSFPTANGQCEVSYVPYLRDGMWQIDLVEDKELAKVVSALLKNSAYSTQISMIPYDMRDEAMKEIIKDVILDINK